MNVLIGFESPIYAILALMPYRVAISPARSFNSIVASYVGFEEVEFIEDLVSIISLLGGMSMNYLVDFHGATS